MQQTLSNNQSHKLCNVAKVHKSNDVRN